MDNPTPGKTCLGCGETKELEAYVKHPHGSFGRHPRCRACMAEDRKKRRERLGDEIREQERLRRSTPEFRAAKSEYNREYRAANSERLREADRVYYRTNREKRRAYQLEWQRADRARQTEYKRRWRAAHPDAVTNDRHIRRAKRARVEGKNVNLRIIWTGFCSLCDDPIDESLKFPDPMSKSLDHIVPLSKGGRHVQDNVQWVHLICNCIKSDSL